MGYNIVRYIGVDDIGTIIHEGLSRDAAMRLAADLNSRAQAGTVFSIERW